MPVTSGVIYSRGSVLGTTKVKSYNLVGNSLAVGTVYTIDAKLQVNGYIEDENDYQYVSIRATAGQTIPLVSGTPGRKIEVKNYTIASSGATAVSFISSGAVVTTINGPLNMAANGTFGGDTMITSIGDTLSVSSSASTINGGLAYRLI